MSAISAFMQRDNLAVIWEALIDTMEPAPELMTGVQMAFNNNIPLFCNRVNPQSSLMDLNKRFLQQMIQAVQGLQTTATAVHRITIMDEAAPLYKVEDIQASRMKDFQDQLSERQKEFEQFVTPPKPDPIDFTVFPGANANQTNAKHVTWNLEPAEPQPEPEVLVDNPFLSRLKKTVYDVPEPVVSNSISTNNQSVDALFDICNQLANQYGEMNRKINELTSMVLELQQRDKK